MTRLMYDGINSLAPGIARAFPDARMVAGYLNGRYAWSQQDWALFPHADHVTVTVSNRNMGDVLDVETGDATPSQTAGWIAMRKAAGLFRPTIYCSLATVPAVRVGTGSYVLGEDYDLWVADYDGSQESPCPLAVAKQYEDASAFDVSVVYDDAWPHRVPPAARAPVPPARAAWPAGVTLREGGTGAAVRVLQEALHDSGEYGARGLEPVDGVFGPGTESAVRDFQADKRLVVDGIAGPATRAALLD
jgi:hypothetical protein